MVRVALYAVGLIALLSALLSPAMAERRVALVIGNSAYENAAVLKNPKNDAEAVATALEGLGFEVVKGIDLTDRGFARTIGDFSEKLEGGADTTVFYYAGHGLQVHGQNYLIPVDARLNREASLDFEAVRLNTILRLMERSRGTNLVFLDACRDNPLGRNLARTMGTRSLAVGRGLARVESGIGTLIAYATQPGNVALDGEGSNSPFTTAFLKHLGTPGLEIEGLMRRIRRDVIAATGGKQVPWDHSSLTATFSFRNQTGTASHEAGGGKGANKLSGSQRARESDSTAQAVELAFWNSIKDSRNGPLFKEYMRRFPDGVFYPIAQARVQELEDAMKDNTPVAGGETGTPAGAVTRSEEQRIARIEPASQPPTAGDEDVLSSGELARTLQKELARVGCNPGPPDGNWGRNSAAALTRYNSHAGTTFRAVEPTREALESVKGQALRVCPAAAVRSAPAQKKPRVVKAKPKAKPKPKPVAREDKLPTGCFAANSGNALCDR
ncbi:MAG: hypothetical protein D6773_01015 [Alphaproteobacteria bacterium]|nr:MAG: hypothetical protein D6773_01015 [Alphaproteobacteria bacterium]